MLKRSLLLTSCLYITFLTSISSGYASDTLGTPSKSVLQLITTLTQDLESMHTDALTELTSENVTKEILPLGDTETGGWGTPALQKKFTLKFKGDSYYTDDESAIIQSIDNEYKAIIASIEKKLILKHFSKDEHNSFQNVRSYGSAWKKGTTNCIIGSISDEENVTMRDVKISCTNLFSDTKKKLLPYKKYFDQLVDGTYLELADEEGAYKTFTFSKLWAEWAIIKVVKKKIITIYRGSGNPDCTLMKTYKVPKHIYMDNCTTTNQ